MTARSRHHACHTTMLATPSHRQCRRLSVCQGWCVSSIHIPTFGPPDLFLVLQCGFSQWCFFDATFWRVLGVTHPLGLFCYSRCSAGVHEGLTQVFTGREFPLIFLTLHQNSYLLLCLLRVCFLFGMAYSQWIYTLFLSRVKDNSWSLFFTTFLKKRRDKRIFIVGKIID